MQNRFTKKPKTEIAPKPVTPPPKSPTPPPRSPTPPPRSPGPRERVERSPREILSIHVGQAGIQIGAAAWQLLFELGQFIRNIFLYITTGKAVPRAVMVDLEPNVVDSVKNSIYGSLYNPRMLISDKEDAAGNYARGYYTIGKQVIDPLLDTIQKAKEQCNALQGILVYHSYGGGAGSGLTSLLMERLNESKVPVMNIPIFSSPKYASSCVEPYNSVLYAGSQYHNNISGCSIMMDNQALYKICESYLDVEIPSFYNTNRLVAQVVSMLTAPLRFSDPASANFNNVINSLVPQPRLKFLSFACAPLASTESTSKSDVNSIHEMSQFCYKSENQFLTLEKKKSEGPFLRSALVYRGHASRSGIERTIKHLKTEFRISKNRLRFSNWNPSEIKLIHGSLEHLVQSQLPPIPRTYDLQPSDLSVCSVSNRMDIAEAFKNLHHKFDLIYAKRAFVHWFVGEGMEEGEFSESRESIAKLEAEYESTRNGS
ncbi:unnamed protein product [Oikopleura dioica]|uniref:Tubulin/FtsZ GTPase domain-containing protein n=1 Tax=Oikopleura dioica TaxID=34765 RepID=E4WY93_OIKDI|nr:unnamed protein product [Oikopleura dioica]